MDERERAKEEFKKLSFPAKLANIWYYNKWFIVLGAIMLIFVLICVVQCTGKKDPDARLLYAGPGAIAPDYFKYVNGALSEVMTDDYNGDGYKTADLTTITVITTRAKDGSDAAIFAATEQMDNYERLQIELSMGATVIYLLDEGVYNGIRDQLVPLADVLGYTPDCAFDEYGIRFDELACYGATGLRYIPHDAILCIRARRNAAFIRSNDDEDYYEQNVAYFRDLVTWLPAEEAE